MILKTQSMEPSEGEARPTATASTIVLEIPTEPKSYNPTTAPAEDSVLLDSGDKDKTSTNIERDDQAGVNSAEGPEELGEAEKSEDSASLMDHIHVLQSKLRDIQIASDERKLQDGILYNVLELNNLTPSVSHSIATAGRFRHQLVKSLFRVSRRTMRNPTRAFEELASRLDQEDGNDDIEEYTDDAIRSFEKEVTRLRQQKSSIEQLRVDIERLRQKEQVWDREREEFRFKQRELDRKLGRPKQRENTESSTGKFASASESEVASVHRVEWAVFKISGANSLKEKKDCHAIDVLKGEPSITFETTQSVGGARKMVRSRAFNIDATARPQVIVVNPKKPPAEGEAPLAERIRINSAHLAKILAKLDSENITDSPGGIMTRPYKLLAFFHETIQQKFQELEIKFGPQQKEGKKTTIGESSPHSKDLGNGVGEGTKKTGSALDVKTSDSESEEEADEMASVENEEDVELTDSPNAYNHLKCLVEFISTDIEAKKQYLKTHPRPNVTFPDLWYLFQPGDEVVGQNRRQAYRIIGIASSSHKAIPPGKRYGPTSDSSNETPIVLRCVHVAFDGKTLGPVSTIIKIHRFEGEKAVTSLEVFPLRFVDLEHKGDKPAQSFRERLIERGRSFLDVTTFKHMHYTGYTIDQRNEVDSNVIVDFEEAFTANPDVGWKPELENLVGVTTEADDNGGNCSADCCKDKLIYEDSFAEQKRNQEYISGLIPEEHDEPPSLAIYPMDLEDIKTLNYDIDEKDLLIMSYRVFGFVLRSREWAELDITHLGPPVGSRAKPVTNTESKPSTSIDPSKEAAAAKDVTTTAEPSSSNPNELLSKPEQKQLEKPSVFDNLVILDSHKKIIRSLVAQHFRDKDAAKLEESSYDDQVDIVRGKGKGLIILLHGAPGVGKTTTAEAVAEMFERPLFQITCGDLGESAAEVDKALSKHFNLANKWGCVLLLDEADVFLAARSKADFKRNGMVAVFLRVLEYYAGILFLTTNRVGDFDEAFTSRIHLSLYYPQLNLEQTQKVFQLNFRLIRERFEERGRQIIVQEKEIIEFVTKYWNDHENERWNGRQIRNACQTALALAEVDAQGEEYGKKPVDPATIVVLEVRHMKTVSAAYLDFMEYLNKVRNKDQEAFAKSLNIRAMEDEVIRELAVAKVEKAQKLKEEREKKRSKGTSLPQQNTAQTPSHLEAIMQPPMVNEPNTPNPLTSALATTVHDPQAVPPTQSGLQPGGQYGPPPPNGYAMPPGVSYPHPGAAYPHPGAAYAMPHPGQPYYYAPQPPAGFEGQQQGAAPPGGVPAGAAPPQNAYYYAGQPPPGANAQYGR